MMTIESIPNAERTFEALRSLGYDLNSSVADILDNAITPKVRAREVRVTFKRRGKKFICRMQDDGAGMTNENLVEAMRIGAESSYTEGDLGKFGLGMKTASLSHCEVLTVISKARRSKAIGYRWDLSHVRESGKWSLLRLTEKETKSLLQKESTRITTHGTLVLWDDLTLLDKEYDSYSSDKLSDNYFYRILGELKLHLRMVFHRFLDGTSGLRVRIFVNGDKLKPWDPFCLMEPKTVTVPMKKECEEFHLPRMKTPIIVHGYVLPTQEGFSSETAWKEARGLQSWNDSQGYYIYRANRLIRYGGWQGTKAKDEHDKLARVSIDIHPSLDPFFRITVNKSKVQLPEMLYHHLKTMVNPGIIRKAQEQYRKSDERLKVKNKLRKENGGLSSVSKSLIMFGRIKTNLGHGSASDSVNVTNPKGTYVSNKVDEFLKHGVGSEFEIVSGTFEGDHLWKVVCNVKEKFKVIVNANHPFYIKVYGQNNKVVTNAIDALIFSLAFSELFNRNDANSILIDTYKSVCAKALEKITTKGLV